MSENAKIEISYLPGQKDKGQQIKIGVSISCVLGHGILIAWMALLTWTPRIAGAALSSEFQVHVLQLALFASIGLWSLILIPLSAFFSSQRGTTVLKALCALFVFVGWLLQYVGPQTLLGQSVSWMCWGFACGSLMALWRRRFAVLKRKSLILSVSLSFIVGSIVFLLIATLSQESSPIITNFMPLIALVFVSTEPRSTALILALKRTKEPGTQASKSAVSLDMLFAATCNLCMGFLASIGSTPLLGLGSPIICGSSVLLSGILIAIALFKSRRNMAYFFARLVLPGLALCLALIGLAPQPWNLAGAALAVAVFGCADIINTSNVSKNSSYGFDYSSKLLGIDASLSKWCYTFGWIVGMALLASNNPANALPVYCLGMLAVMAISLTACNFFGIDRHGFIEHNQLGSNQDAEIQLDSNSAVGAITKPESVEGNHTTPETDMANVIEQAVCSFDLSKREAEVLAYLVSGRNAAHIAKKLFVSHNTAKSHISHIYTKMGVHSQQELIDLIENMQPDANAAADTASNTEH